MREYTDHQLQLKESALKLYDLGLNIVPVGYNVRRHEEDRKSVIGAWEHLQKERQEKSELENRLSDNLHRSTGIGVITGHDNVLCLDFDKVIKKDLVYDVLDILGLPEDYAWAAISGSGSDHLYIKCDVDFTEGVRTWHFEDPDFHADHMEIRRSQHTVLPPSLHKSGDRYRWRHEEPTEPPTQIRWDDLLDLKKYLHLHDRKEQKKKADKPAKSQQKTAPVQAKKPGKDKSFGEFENELDDNFDYLKFMRENFPGGETQVEEGKEIRVGERGSAAGTINIYGKKWNQFSTDTSGIGIMTLWNFVKNGVLPDDKPKKKEYVKLLKEIANSSYSFLQWPEEFSKVKDRPDPKKTFEDQWWEIDRKGDINILQSGLAEFITQKLGIRKYHTSETEIGLIQRKDCLAKPVGWSQIVDLMMHVIKNMPDVIGVAEKKNADGEIFEVEVKKRELLEKLVQGKNVYFGSNLAYFFELDEMNMNRDTREVIHFYFNNGYVEVTEAGAELKPYSQLKKLVYKSSVIDHEIKLDNKIEGDFNKFIQNVTNNEEQRTHGLKTAIGYMISTYKDPSKAKVVTLLDEAIADDPQGRTGKGIIFQALSQIRNVVSINGKAFDPGSAFALQEVKADTEIIVFNDVKRKFPFEWLYSAVTDGFSVNPKGKSSFFLPFDTSPKFAITSNYMIQGEGSSHTDRIHEQELAPYYSDKFKPIDEFKRTFFGPKWDADEWNSFFQFMFSCAKDYLKYSLVEAKSVNIQENKLRQFTAPEFVEWADYELMPKYEDDPQDSTHGRYNKKNLLTGGGANTVYKSFVETYPDFKKYTQRTFTKWLRDYAEYRGWSWDEKASNGERLITFYAHYKRADEQQPAGRTVEREAEKNKEVTVSASSSPANIVSSSPSGDDYAPF